ncbi:MAG: hypothetical protein ACI9OJ_001998 [Myxococcota bacterium]|jgi:hypothetical protein
MVARAVTRGGIGCPHGHEVWRSSRGLSTSWRRELFDPAPCHFSHVRLPCIKRSCGPVQAADYLPHPGVTATVRGGFIAPQNC